MKDRAYNFFKYIGEYSLYGLIFFLPISNALLEIFVILALIGFAGRKIIKADFGYLKFWPNICLIFFMLFSAFSLFNSGAYLNKSLNALFGKWFQYLSIYIVVQDVAYDKKIFKRVVSVFLLSATLVVLSGLSQYFLGVEFLRNRSMGYIDGKTDAVTSTFTHYNNFGGYIVVILSVASALFLSSNYFRVSEISLLIFTIFSTATLILTFSRGSWLAAIASFIFVSIISKRNLKRLIPVFLLIFIMFLFPLFHDRFFLIFETSGDRDRLLYWKAAIKMIQEHPLLGTGVGTFMANFSKYLPNLYPAYAHNCYLQIFAETGVFSLLAFVAFVASFIYLGIKKFIVSKDYLLLGLLTGVVGFLVHSFFDTDLYSLSLAILFWVLVGLIFARLRVTNK